MNLSVSKILAAIQIFWGIVAANVTWYVSIEGEIGAATFLVCGYYLPDARSTACITAALVSAIRAGVSQGNNYGVTESPLTPPKLVRYRLPSDYEDLQEEASSPFRMIHVGVNGNHSFLNVDDMYEGWNQILLEHQSFDLKARRLENNQTQISTVGFNAYLVNDGDFDDEPQRGPSFPRARHFRRQNRIYKEQELVMTHQWPTGFLASSQAGLQDAANGAAGFVANAAAGSYTFCSTVYSPAGLKGEVAFSFYGDYAPEDPPPCYSS